MCIGRVAWICWSGWDYCVDRVTGHIILGVRGIGPVGLFSEAWASYARRGLAGWGINCVDRATGEIILVVRGIVPVGLFSEAWALYARRGFAGWGINCVDRATEIGAFLGGA